MQHPPPPQVLAAQHRLPLEPHALHVPGRVPLQIVFGSLHTRPGQQSSPRPPHTRHVPATHTAPLWVHVLASQHGWPSAPHDAQFPATHTDVESVQVLPGQHAWFAAPHVPPMQVPFVQLP